MAKKKKRASARRIFIVIALVVAIMIAGTGALAYYLGVDSLPGSGGSINKRVSFLLIGTDQRLGESSYNADSIIVASFDPETKLVSLLSVPRDTRVTLAGSSSNYKINSIPMVKGISELKKQVTDLTGIKLDGYVKTNFAGFKDIVDTLGGITIDVEKDMYYETGDKEDGYINLKAGVQELNGSKALQYARYRNDATADIGRTARQQKVLMTVGKKMLAPATILKLPKLIPDFMNAVETDLSLKDLLKLAGAAKSFDDVTIVSQTLPGDAVMLNGLSYWEVNRDTVKDVVRDLLLGKTTDDVWDTSVLASLPPDIKAQLVSPAKETVIDIREMPGISVPVAGAVPVRTIQTEQYSGTVTWSPDDNLFFAGEKYTATITLVPKAGYTLKGVAADFFTVTGATVRNTGGSGVVNAVFPRLPSEPVVPKEPTEPTEPTDKATTISLTVISGVTPPQTGARPVTTITETEQFSGTISWIPIDNPFVEGREYTATITLVPKKGFTLEGVGDNYFTVQGATTSNAAGSGIIKAVFPLTQ